MEISSIPMESYSIHIFVTHAKSSRKIFLSKRKYVLDFISDIGVLGCKPVASPFEANHKPDIAYVVGVVSQYMHDPRETHTDAVHCIMRYLKTTPGYFAFVGGNLVTWRINKQTVVARSNADAEYRVVALGVSELLWT
ncbi:uncharacterized mitochondrial protein AtMg00810-like [Impatiens glandulifera]|uniref:uncharacterized mitochondrial protein AtMg00810-like n=1 Tax=Impatiens glandulifera TaxID=253017 RepID=UPI001FB18A34|nr:uncharacterized mitochondrial protein AtMg00810-like [Impatiens glandulifera]